MRFDELYERLSKVLPVDVRENASNGHPNHVITVPKGLVKVRVGDYGSGIDDQFKRKRSDTFSSVVAVSKHFVTKPLYKITVAYITDDTKVSVVTTNDHTCAVYNEKYEELMRLTREFCTIDDISKYSPDKLISFKSAKELKIGDIVPFIEHPIEEDLPDMLVPQENHGFDGEVCWSKTSFGNGRIEDYTCDGAATVVGIEEIDNSKGSWVYDLEVESGRHVYYANGILVHNSQFMNLAPITQHFCEKVGISKDTTFAKLPDDVRKNVIDEAYHILDLINENVKNLINKNCHTSQGDSLHYALEYIASEGMYFAKKCYIVHKIIEDDFPCNKFKYSGVAVKKAEIPASMKTFLKEVYENTMTSDTWNEKSYVNKVNEAYNTFRTLDWEDLSYYKKYRTKKEAKFEKNEETGKTEQTLESEKGALAFARAVNIWNALLKQLNLGGKYPSIDLGDDLRWSYILPTNKYGIDVIAYKNNFPSEFKDVFTVDYNKMFTNIFIRPLEHYIEIMDYATHDPKQQTENPEFDIF